MSFLTIDTSQAKREVFKIRAQFQKLERVVVAQALLEASEPQVAAAQAGAPVLKTPKRGRQPGQLRGKIGPTLIKQSGTLISVAVGATRQGKNDKQFPFWDRFQEQGWRATGRAKASKAKRFTAVPGKHFLQTAGTQTFRQVEQIFAARIFQRFGEIQSAGEAAGLV